MQLSVTCWRERTSVESNVAKQPAWTDSAGTVEIGGPIGDGNAGKTNSKTVSTLGLGTTGPAATKRQPRRHHGHGEFNA